MAEEKIKEVYHRWPVESRLQSCPAPKNVDGAGTETPEAVRQPPSLFTVLKEKKLYVGFDVDQKVEMYLIVTGGVFGNNDDDGQLRLWNVRTNQTVVSRKFGGRIRVHDVWMGQFVAVVGRNRKLCKIQVPSHHSWSGTLNVRCLDPMHRASHLEL